METLFPLGGPAKDREIRRQGTREGRAAEKAILESTAEKGRRTEPVVEQIGRRAAHVR